MERTFLTQQVARQYDPDRRRAETLAVATAVIIAIGAMGLFGLSASALQQRSREVGLRKVLGARMTSLLRLFIWQFSKPILLAIAVASPLAFFVSRRWLESFSLRIELTPVPFLIVGFAALLIAWVTVLGHALRVASVHPTVALRDE